LIAAFVTPAFAADEFYLVQDAKTEKCTIVDKKPHDHDGGEPVRCDLQEPHRSRSRDEDREGLHLQLTASAKGADEAVGSLGAIARLAKRTGRLDGPPPPHGSGGCVFRVGAAPKCQHIRGHRAPCMPRGAQAVGHHLLMTLMGFAAPSRHDRSLNFGEQPQPEADPGRRRLAAESQLSNAVLDMPPSVVAVPEEDGVAGAIARRRHRVAFKHDRALED
jgi:hypothetical protein